ncbi:MAG: alpha/beta hydrolase fold domain-containing protein [Streptococcaceae bacterium]|jgi:acetyl esterase/lipase|nr:alpha/beta hydrolase fold domain-containing protein [Streptococcaceae bacterium]
MNFTNQTTIGEVLINPEFKPFARYIFPVKQRRNVEYLTIDDIHSLLPYHQNVEVTTTIEVLNYFQNEVKKDRQLFYDIYNEDEKREDSAKKDTGLFFFKGKPGKPFAIICTGGGFHYCGSIHESYPLAIELAKQGFNVFTIEYRVGSARKACEDLARGLSFIFRHADEFELTTDNYSIWGGSAGARMAAYLGEVMGRAIMVAMNYLKQIRLLCNIQDIRITHEMTHQLLWLLAKMIGLHHGRQ